jgi:mono/diheme cytochrome c family protein
MKRSLGLSSLLLVLLSLGLAGCSISLAADVTPPPDYQPPQQPVAQQVTPEAAETSLPLLPPDLSAGAATYAEKCAPCHGADGQGNGPQAAKLPSPPPAIGKLEVAQDANPVEWFNIISRGNMQKFMPGFSGSLDARQRWDVVAYVLSLSATQDQLALGKKVYQQACQECHGSAGHGDGPSAGGKNLPNWGDPAQLAQRSLTDLANITAKGIGSSMPAFKSSLDINQRQAVAQYIRTLSYAVSGDQTASNTPQATPNISPAPTSLTPQPVTNGTPQASPNAKVTFVGKVVVPEANVQLKGLKVTLSGLDMGSATADQGHAGMTESIKLTTEVAQDGSYQFSGVETTPERVFIAAIEYDKNIFNTTPLSSADLSSEQSAGANGEKSYTLPSLQVYESSTDISVLSADRMHVFFDFSEPGKLTVAEMFIISNMTEKVIRAEQEGKAVLDYPLPEGASNLKFNDGALGERFIQSADGFGDTVKIYPGSGHHQVMFAYDLPYNNSQKVAIKLPVSVEALVVMAPSEGISIKSAQLTSSGTRNVQGSNIQIFSGAKLSSGTLLEMNVSGLPKSSAVVSTEGNAQTFSTNNLALGLLVFAVVLIGIGVWWYVRQRSIVSQAEPVFAARSREEIMDEIISLDDVFKTGQMDEAEYRLQRSSLKQELAKLVEKTK